MTAAELIAQAAAAGVTISLTPAGRLRMVGDDEAIDRYLPVVHQYGAALAAELKASLIDEKHNPEAT